jgi:isomaltose glucohydrolase
VTDGPAYPALLDRSVEVILENQHPGGAYVASPSLEAYRLSWLRDGAFVADAMSRAGRGSSAEAFFGWVARLVEARAEAIVALVLRRRSGDEIGRDEHLHCRYTVDGREHEAPWSNHQLDGWAMWLWCVDGHSARHGWEPEPIRGALALVTRYVTAFATEPCFDWWEERWGRHVATLAAVSAGLDAAAGWSFLPSDVRAEAARVASEARETILRDGVEEGRLAGRLEDARLDGSLIACATPFRVLAPGDPVMEETVRALHDELAHGGVHRYPGDRYYGGGEWLLLAALLGWWALEAGREELARSQLAWVAAQARAGDDLPEQVSHHLLVPEAYAEWEDRWGPPPIPLLWSHAWFLALALALGYDVRYDS